MSNRPTHKELERRIKGLEKALATRPHKKTTAKITSECNELFNAIPGFVSVHDLDFKFVKVNKTLADFLGVKQEELIGKPCYKIIHGTDEPYPDCPHAKALKLKKPVTGDIDIPHLGCSLLVSATPLFDDKDKVVGTAHIAQDITKQKQTERKLTIKNRISEIFLTVPDEEMYAQVLQVVLAAMESKYGVFGYIDENGAMVCPSMTKDIWNKCQMAEKTIIFPRETWGGNWGKTLKDKKSLYSNGPFKTPEGHIPITRNLVTPIVYRGQLIGGIQVANKNTDYDNKDKDFLEKIAEHVAPVLCARLSRDRKEKARTQAESKLKRTSELQNILNEILKLSIEPHSLKEILDRALVHILAISSLTLQPKGLICTVGNKADELTMESCCNISEEQKTMCAKIPFGRCICGQAAQSKDLQFADFIDGRHSITYKDIPPHGHYCVPLLYSDKVVGVLNLYLKAGHQRNKGEEDFLLAIANVLAGIIERKKTEKELYNYRNRLEALVKERTTKLASTNKTLAKEIATRKKAQEQQKIAFTQFQTITKNQDALLYVADMDSYEILFINEAGKKFWGNVVGKICWKTLQSGQTGPCGFCTNDKLLDKKGRSTGVYHWEFQNSANNQWYDCRDQVIPWTDGRLVRMEIATNITKRKQTEKKLLNYTSFLHNCKKINQAISSTTDLEKMMRDVLDTVLSIFGCDRAWFLYPCDPKAATWKVPMERTNPKHPGLFALGQEVPMAPDAAEIFELALTTNEPISFGPKSGRYIPTGEEFHTKSQLIMTIYPKTDKPWLFGIHQCSYAREWTNEEIKLFHEIALRVTDSFSSLLFMRDLRASETKFRNLFQNMTGAVALHKVIYDKNNVPIDYIIIDINPAYETHTGLKRKDAIGRKASILYDTGSAPYFDIYLKVATTGEPTSFETYFEPMQKYFSISVFSPNKGQFATVLKDITEQKQGETELSKFKFISDNASDAHFIQARDAKFIYVNKTACNIMGYSEEEFLNLSVPDVDIVYDQDKYHELFDLVQQEVVPPFETMNKRKDGSLFPSEITSTGYQIDGKPYMFAALRNITERKQIEEALQTRATEYKTILETAQDGFWRVNDKGCFMDVNDAYCRLIGYSRDELLTMCIPDVDALENKDATEKRMREIIKHGGAKFETKHRCKDGKLVDIDVRTNYVDGIFFVFLRNITERKQTEEALVFERDKILNIMNSMRDGVYIVDKKYNIQYLNPAIEKEFGTPTDQKCYKYLHKRQKICPWCKNPKVFKGKTVRGEWQSANTGKTYDIVDTPLKNPDGSISKLKILHDITERKKREEELLRHAHEMDALNNISQHVSSNLSVKQVIQAAIKGMRRTANPDLAILFILEGDNLLLKGQFSKNKNFSHDKIPPHRLGECLCGYVVKNREPVYSVDIRNDPRCTWEECKKADFQSIACLPLGSKDKSIGCIALASMKTRNFEAQAVFLETLANEISIALENALLYEELKEHGQTLEKRVQEEVEKSRQKDYIMLHQSRLAAMGEMVGLIAHQWRQPLSALNFLMYNIKTSCEENKLEQKTLVEDLKEGETLIWTMSNTIDDFRSFFQPDKKKEPFNINKKIKDSLSMLIPSYVDKDIAVKLNENTQVDSVGFPNEYSHALLNILNNAKDAILKTHKSGTITINISQKSDSAIVKIKDNGGGISKKHLDKIFNPYFTTKPKEEGTGLGLYISKVIIEEHMGGNIEVNQVKGGTEFKITTPNQI